MDLLPLEALGRRIVIVGPSGAGKSTLAAALGQKLGVPVAYLDQLFYRPHTKWEPRTAAFDALHAAVIAGDGWVTDGNYAQWLVSRLARATGVIWVDVPRWQGMLGYIKRSFGHPNRLGRLEGAPDGINWKMTHYILIGQPNKRQAISTLLDRQSIPVLRLKSAAELKAAWRDWELKGSA